MEKELLNQCRQLNSKIKEIYCKAICLEEKLEKSKISVEIQNKCIKCEKIRGSATQGKDSNIISTGKA